MADEHLTALLLSPTYDRNEYIGAESLGLRYIAGALAGQGASVTVVDECETPLSDETVRTARKARLLGIGTLFTRQIPEALQLARTLRELAPDAHIVFGGQGVEFLWKQVLEDCPAIDSVCTHEADETVVDLWAALVEKQPLTSVKGLYLRAGEKIAHTGVRPPVADLDSLPLPFRGTREDGYADGHATMSTSRGCAAHCTFCQSGNYGNRYHKLPRWRSRSAEGILDEITHLVSAFNVRAISFVDDDFLGGDGRGVDRAMRLSRLLRDQPYKIRFSIECRINELDREVLQSLRDVGLRHILIGIESANDADIRLFAKRTTNEQARSAILLLRDLDIDFSAGFIMFHPLSNFEGLKTNLDFMAANAVGTYRRVANRLELYPGAPLLSYFSRRSVQFREEKYRIYYDFVDPRVASCYQSFRDMLRPFVEVENRCGRLLFSLTTGVDHDAPRLVAEVRATADLIATRLVESASLCLTLAAQGDDPRKDHLCQRRISAWIDELQTTLDRHTQDLRDWNLGREGGES